MLASTGLAQGRARDKVASSCLFSTLLLIPENEGSYRHSTFTYERQSAGNVLVSAKITKCPVLQSRIQPDTGLISAQVQNPKFVCLGAIFSDITT